VLDEIVREAARQMLAVALQAEVSACVDAHTEEVDENGHRLVLRNGHHNESPIRAWYTTRGAQIVSSPLSIEISRTRPPNARSDVRKLRCQSGLREGWVTNPTAMPWFRPKTPVRACTPLKRAG
jgi:hypothetical protein